MTERTPGEQLLWDIFGSDERVCAKTDNPHDHTEYVEGCFRCDLNRDEEASDDD